ncbi:MAG: serine/threonine protein kinase, partial [marine benthic group bacterium]|nr:serine/threonine protein kinase [Gemmatimonadota bacterium]
ETALHSALEGRYVIAGEVGRGGMSVVFRAHDLKHDCEVAIKVLRPELSEQIGAERFHREIEVVAGLTHPYILPLLDSGEAGGLLYYVMPCMEGGSLKDRISSEGAISERDALRIAAEVADALGFAHANGVIHRDVKPGNILLSDGHAILADFGVAHLATEVEETLTEAGLALGTPAYLSPEQASGDGELDGRSDLYSLGCVLYEALTGSPPFKGEGVRAVLIHQILDTPPSVRSLNENISAGAAAIVKAALRKDPGERFQTGKEMADALQTAAGELHGLVALLFRRAGIPRRHTSTAAIAAAAILAATAVSVLFLARDRILEPGPTQGRPAVRYVVLDYAAPDASDTEISLSMQAARVLRDLLDGWRSVSVVPEAAMEGPAAELFTAGVAPSSYALGTGLAERFDADYRVQVQVTSQDPLGVLEPVTLNRGQPVQIDASVFHESRDRLFDTFVEKGPVDSLAPMMIRIAMQILDLQGDVEDWDLLRARSPDHRAVAALDSARAALWSWRLAEAHRLLENALERDSTFALAHHLLAETMYWEMAQDDERLFELGGKIDHHSRLADLYADGRLRPGEQQAVDAFRAFWAGHYDSARVLYDSLIRHEANDLEALVMRGAVEVEDPIAIVTGDGTRLPRRNLNTARSLFDTATALNPIWELAFGHMHEINLDVTKAARLRWYGLGFEGQDAEPVTPYAKREAGAQFWFCPVIEADTIAWRSMDGEGCPIDEQAETGAAELHARTVERLDWMADVRRDQPRHHEELAEFLLWERSLSGCDGDPVRSDSLLALASSHIHRALGMRSDTTPSQRVFLANLHLASGDLAAARAAAGRALEDLPDWQSRFGTPPPTSAANPFLASGDARLPARIIERVWAENSASLQDPVDPEAASLSTHGQWGRLNVLQALGSVGATGPEATERLSLLRRAWRSAPMSDRDHAALRLASLPFVGPALVHLPEEWDAWFGGWAKYDLPVPPVWAGLLAAAENPPDLAGARAYLTESVALLGTDPFDSRVRAVDLYLPILLAQQTGADEIEAELIGRLSVCTPSVNGFDASWGVMGSLEVLD